LYLLGVIAPITLVSAKKNLNAIIKLWMWKTPPTIHAIVKRQFGVFHIHSVLVVLKNAPPSAVARKRRRKDAAAFPA